MFRERTFCQGLEGTRSRTPLNPLTPVGASLMNESVLRIRRLSLGLLLIGLLQAAVLAQPPRRYTSERMADLEAKVSAFIGPTRAECGRYVWNGRPGPLASVADLEASLACALASAESKVPFWFVIAGPGLDSWVADGILGDQKGQLYRFNFDDNSFWPGDPSPPTFRVNRCLNPKVKAYEKGYAGFECLDEQTLVSWSIASDASIVWDDFIALIRRVGLR